MQTRSNPKYHDSAQSPIQLLFNKTQNYFSYLSPYCRVLASLLFQKERTQRQRFCPGKHEALGEILDELFPNSKQAELLKVFNWWLGPHQKRQQSCQLLTTRNTNFPCDHQLALNNHDRTAASSSPAHVPCLPADPPY